LQGGDWVFGVCAAIEGEKDPRCLLVAFHLVESLGLLFPLAEFAEDLFEIVSRYFPVSFTPVGSIKAYE
jgi:DNA repair/transcription protein MET18/MMS19